MTKKLLLVNPKYEGETWWNGKHTMVSPYATALLASMVPENWAVEIVDERLRKLTFGEEADLVGITSMACLVPKARKIAKGFMDKGIPVVLGGYYASACPENASEGFTSVVSGEAESVFPEVLRDAEKGDLKRIYHGGHGEISTKPARFDLLPGSYAVYTVQTSRGCSNGCSYCSIPVMYGNGRRFRDLDTVLEEVKLVPNDRILFADDDIFGVKEKDKERAQEMLRRLASETNKKWSAETTIYGANDEALLELAARSGCVNLLIGFDSPNTASLREVRKGINLTSPSGFEEYVCRTVEKCHRYGIGVTGVFIFGFDHDGPDVFGRTVKLIKDAGIDTNRFEILTPLPSTPLHGEMQARISDRNLAHYDFSHAVFEPMNMTGEELERYMMEALTETSSLTRSTARALRTAWDVGKANGTGGMIRTLYGTGISYLQNISMGAGAARRLSQYR